MYVNIDNLKEILLEDLEKTTADLKEALLIKGSFERDKMLETTMEDKSLNTDTAGALRAISKQIDDLHIRLTKISTALTEIGHPIYAESKRNKKSQVYIKPS